MHRSQIRSVAAAAWLASAACTSNPEPATPPLPATAAGHEHAPDAAPAVAALPPDAQFLHHMIPHHAQALVMTALVPARAARPELRLVAERIAVSQRDEIAQMQGWLEARGHPLPAADTVIPGTGGDGASMAHGAHTAHAVPASAHAGMPGMLTPAELASLAAARGPAFDRLFLELMIRHHEGAITMVRDLFSRGGGQDSQVYAIASEVESDQRMEIARMQALLATLPSPAAGPR